ncbi:MAG TPA: L-threonylcarbamoyladenylate synthase [Pirellulales bacterium]
MSTRRLVVDPVRPDPASLRIAADVLSSGGLVAFPTETVYGLGALALDEASAAKIFAAKGRPATNPLIVHVPDLAAARELASDWTQAAETLARAFWPGPLSLVVAKAACVPDLVTAGGPTTALRVPAHPTALALLQTLGRPLAAPSANRSNAVSPTRGDHVLATLDGRIDLLLDAGPCSGGLESTVVDATEWPPRLLRPGLISPAQLSAVLGVEVARGPKSLHGPLASPGMLEKHYSPRAKLEIAPDDGRLRVAQHLAAGAKVGWITRGETSGRTDDVSPRLYQLDLPAEAAGYAAEIYAALHTLDAAGVERLVVAALPSDDDWLAARDRLTRASAE